MDMEEQDVQEHEENEPVTDQDDAGDGAQEHDAPPPDQHQETETERRAREKGWTPKDQYQGRPENWVDAEEYLKRPPEIRQERDTLAREVASLKRTMEILKKDTSSLTERAEREGYERAMNALAERQRRAVEDGNIDEFNAAEEDRRKLEPPATRKVEDGQQPVDPVISDWAEQNAWFNADKVLNAAMFEEMQRVQLEAPGLPLEDKLERATARLKADYPRRFGLEPNGNAEPSQQQYRRPQRVSGQETRGGNSSGNGSAKGWNDIPSEDRAIAMRELVGPGKPYAKKEDYATSYWRQYG